ncbi:hypothetical protein ACI3L3_13180 [Desulfobaculum sp. SPO524]
MTVCRSSISSRTSARSLFASVFKKKDAPNTNDAQQASAAPTAERK